MSTASHASLPDDPAAPAYLASGEMVDSDHPAIRAFVARVTLGAGDERERAVALYYAVRDGVRYDPYRVDLSVAGMRASTGLVSGHGWCVVKAALLAACARAAGIPARLGFADVRNHLSTERMRRAMQTDLFCWHGYTELWLGRWVKATPAFNIELCRKFAILPLEFDGVHDSLYHPFDARGERHMEYVRERGIYVDVPLAEIRASFAEVYPALMAQMAGADDAAFLDDVERETAGPGAGQAGGECRR